ncbi:hypothetical protein [Lacticaseibacillus paracasei]|uniref:hypothetical protein n=1 Tax=Lacticaseibacillus paracasei TaxID=1597 RepID=UPI0021D2F875|nr:hypothetical protein [Lacticaseibacillus paracasei]MCU6431364.1 hypothetical protein [Lacticaseibacillus paracasei]
MKRTLGICSAMLVVLGLVGCQSNSADNSPKQETSSKHQTKTESEHSSKAKLAAASKKKAKDASKARANSISKPQAAIVSSVESESQANNENTQKTTQGIDLHAIGTPPNFHFNGVNVPSHIALDANLSRFSVYSWNESHNGVIRTATGSFTKKVIPMKTVRIFSAPDVHFKNDPPIRSVQVNTELDFASNDARFSGGYYIFKNRIGSYSLVTPNFAGNVDVNDQDIMIEARQGQYQ